ncbi:MAG TPA: hypothetical protein VMV10_01490 [Pirellulales bacterium]|nr:hypothetical protein [Pirellulales bacterium]
MMRLILLLVLAFSPILIPELGRSFGFNGLFNNSTNHYDRESSVQNSDRKSQEQRTYAIVGGIVVAAYLIADAIRAGLGSSPAGRLSSPVPPPRPAELKKST